MENKKNAKKTQSNKKAKNRTMRKTVTPTVTPEKSVKSMVEIKMLNLGKISFAGFSSDGNAKNMKDILTNPKKIDAFVKKIKPGPTLVTLPVAKMRHVLLIDVQPYNEKIMVADWNANSFIELFETDRMASDIYKNHVKSNKKEWEKWELYFTILAKIQEKYGDLPIEFYEIDEDLHADAHTKSETCSGGGCSEYIIGWINPMFIQITSLLTTNNKRNSRIFYNDFIIQHDFTQIRTKCIHFIRKTGLQIYQ